MSFTVAIIGRPNVGKSTLFNRLVGRRLALVDDRPGVTRDRREGEARLGDLAFTVVDTAGFEESAPDSLSGRMRAQTETAIAQADAIFFMIDARQGPTPVDRAFAAIVHKSGKPTVLIANKMEGSAGEARPPGSLCARFWRAGADLGRAQRRHVRSLRRAARGAARGRPRCRQKKRRRAEAHPIRVAIVGRPNAGKSTLDQPADRRGASAHRRRRPASRATPSRSISTGTTGNSASTTPPACAANRASRRSWRSCRSPTRSTPCALPKSWWF